MISRKPKNEKPEGELEIASEFGVEGSSLKSGTAESELGLEEQ